MTTSSSEQTEGVKIIPVVGLQKDQEKQSTTPFSIETTGEQVTEAVTQLNTAVTSESGTSGLPEGQSTKETVISEQEKESTTEIVTSGIPEAVTQLNTAVISEQEKESATEIVTSGLPESVTQLNTAVTSEEEKQLTTGLPEGQTTKLSTEENVTNGGESTTSESVTKIIVGVIQGQEDQGISTVLQSEGQEALTTPLSIQTTQNLESVTSGPSEAVTQLNTAVTSEQENQSTTGLIQTTKETVTSGEEEKSTTPLSGIYLTFYKLKYI
jgi:hypothetical protein